MFPHISASSVSKSEFMHFPGMGSRGKEKSRVLLLCFFQISTSVLSDTQTQRLAQCSLNRSMSTVFTVRVSFPRNRKTELLGENLIQQGWSLSEMGFGVNDWGWGRRWGGGRKILFFKTVISSSLWAVAENVLIAFESVLFFRTRIQ